MKSSFFGLVCLVVLHVGLSQSVVLQHGTIYDGSGHTPYSGDVTIKDGKIASIDADGTGRGDIVIDVRGLAVAPGFINMLSWATESLIEDGRAQSDIRQGVTLEVFGEGESMGPLTEKMKADLKGLQGDLRFDIAWTTLGEYLSYLERKGVSVNVASFIGATTVRVNVIGYEDRAPTPTELDRMRALVAQAMKEGAMGVGSSLIYAPAFYAKTDELIELCKVAKTFDGMYISHIRSEGNRLVEAVDELLRICRESGIRSEIYHLKAAGRTNWPKMESVLRKVEQARSQGLEITADMYTYEAGATGLDAAMPPWVQEGGLREWIRRLKDPVIRDKVRREMSTPTDAWENLYLAAGSADKVLLVAFKQDSLKYLTGKPLAEVARIRGRSIEETAMDLVIDDDSRVGTVYFMMSEENIRSQIRKPWVSFGSDAEALSPEGVFLKSNPHPRAYGNFARLLGSYVRDKKVISLEEAVRRLSALPASNLRLKDRGLLRTGSWADVVVFDTESVTDRATFDRPHQYSVGMRHVFVNGIHVLKNGEHTGATPGRFVRGPGWVQN